MDNNDVSRSSMNSNMYQSIVEENTSMYYSFNETLKSKMQTSYGQTNVRDNETEFVNSNPGTVIKKNIEMSSAHIDGDNIASNKNILMMNMRKFSSQTSTPTQSPIIKYNKSQQQLQKVFKNKTEISENTGNISGVTAFGLEQQNSEIIMENESKNDNTSNLLSSKVESISASLREFEKLEKITTNDDGQELKSNDDCFAQNKEKESDNFELSRQTKRKSIESYIDELNLSQITLKDVAEKNGKNLVNATNKEPQIPKIVIESPRDEKERNVELLNTKNTKSMNTCSIYENENKENVNILANSKNENDLNKLQNSVTNTSIKKSFTHKTNSAKKISAAMNDSKSSITSNEKSPSILSEKSNGKMNETSAKESEDEKKSQLDKMKKRRSIRVLQGTRKSLIEETDSSSGTLSSNRVVKKLPRLDIDSIKLNLKKSSTAINKFKKPVGQIQKQPSNHENRINEIGKHQNDKSKMINKEAKTQLVALGSSSKMNALQTKNEDQKTVNDKRKTVHQISSTTETNGALKSKSILANRKSVHLKVEKSVKKQKTRLTNIVKTTLNSPSMVRRNSISKLSPRKSMIPLKDQDKNFPKIEKSTATKSSTTADTVKNLNIPATLYNCRVCHASFRLKSSFETHKKTHETAIQCEYCDKKFSLSKALDNHLIEKCLKIPPLAKKKLIQSANKKKISEQEQQQSRNTKEPSSVSSASSLKCSTKFDQDTTISLKIFTVRKITNNEEKLSELVLPSSLSSTLKKTKLSKIPFSGIYRTPSKPIKCYICKKSFFNVLTYTEHTLSHSSASAQSSSESSVTLVEKKE